MVHFSRVPQISGKIGLSQNKQPQNSSSWCLRSNNWHVSVLFSSNEAQTEAAEIEKLEDPAPRPRPRASPGWGRRRRRRRRRRRWIRKVSGKVKEWYGHYQKWKTAAGILGAVGDEVWGTLN